MHVVNVSLGLALVYWFRDCDPALSGAITQNDQVCPYIMFMLTETRGYLIYVQTNVYFFIEKYLDSAVRL